MQSRSLEVDIFGITTFSARERYTWETCRRVRIMRSRSHSTSAHWRSTLVQKRYKAFGAIGSARARSNDRRGRLRPRTSGNARRPPLDGIPPHGACALCQSPSAARAAAVRRGHFTIRDGTRVQPQLGTRHRSEQSASVPAIRRFGNTILDWASASAAIPH